jgi:hypothetical protein
LEVEKSDGYCGLFFRRILEILMKGVSIRKYKQILNSLSKILFLSDNGVARALKVEPAAFRTGVDGLARVCREELYTVIPSTDAF